jgi:two-component sensor histidine kinase
MAILATIAALLLRELLDPMLEERAVFPLITLATMVSAWYGGLGPGLLATGLGTLGAALLFVPPRFALTLTVMGDGLALSLFILAGVCISVLSERLHHARRQAQAEATERRQAEAAVRQLNRDLEHRIAEFDTLFTVIPVGIAVAKDPECRHMWLNPCMSKLFHLLPGVNASVSAPPEERSATYRVFRDGRELPPEELPMQYAAAHGVEVQGVEVDVLHEERITKLLCFASPLFDPEGRVRGCLGAFVDITERKRMEEQLKASLRDKEMLLKEVHHRVKNNLQVVSSLLTLQRDTLQDPMLRECFHESERRIRAMSLIHETLYQTTDVARLNVAQYLQTLSAQLLQSYGVDPHRIAFTTQLEAVVLSPDTAIPLGLILNELLSNALKHAFPHGRSGTIAIELNTTSDGHATLHVRDTGVGFPEGLDFRETDSLGLQLVCALTEQLEGTIKLERDGGTVFALTFPLPHGRVS